jgi:hypothetical protein
VSNLKDELLRLLREDEGFRIEVMRLLGIINVNASLNQLIESVNKLTKSIEDLREEVRKLWEENHRIWEEIRELRKNHEDLARTVRGISRDLGGLSRTVGKLVEQDIRHYLPGWVRERYDITVDRIRRLRLDSEAEFDGFVETEDKVLLIEIKTTLRSRDIRDLARKVDRYRERAPGGKLIIPIVAYSMEGESLGRLLNAAKAYGITLVKHHGEYEFEEVSQ